jgi:uncharacterized protein
MTCISHQRPPAQQRTHDSLIDDVLCNPNNRALLEGLPELALPDCWLVAGCLFQTVWNLQSSRPPAENISDYDVFYFDASDLSSAAEAAHNERAARLFAPLGVTVEVKNQARVHRWFEAYFGYPYSALRDSREGIDRYLVLCTCVDVQPTRDGYSMYAPHGLDDLYAGVLHPNPINAAQDLYTRKAQSYAARWPWLQVCFA